MTRSILIAGRAFGGLLLFALARPASLAAADLPSLWKERVKSIVAIEFSTETEIDRAATVVFGLVADTKGDIALPSDVINPRVTFSQLKDFRIYLPGQPTTDYAQGEFLGDDPLSGWNWVRIKDTPPGDGGAVSNEEKLRAQLVPITRFAAPAGGGAEPQMGEEDWGIAMRAKDEDFLPYLMSAKVALVQSLPERTAIALGELASPGLPVFDKDGVFAGIAIGGFGSSYREFSRTERGAPIMLVNVEESRVFVLAGDALPWLARVPVNVDGRPIAWFGGYGLETLDPEVASYLKLGDQAGCVVSQVLETSPAAAAGLQEKDIIVAIDGQPLPRLKPDRVVVAWVEREFNRRKPGDKVSVTVLRGTDHARVDLAVTLADEPKMAREADRLYFEKLGLTAREFVFGDGVARRVKLADQRGVIANFVKNSGPASAAGLRADDWIQEIDGAEVKTYADALAKFSAIEADASSTETVLVVSRGGETQVLHVKLK
jgi:serine protease Do